MRALSVLNFASNNLGELVLPEGWIEDHHGEDHDHFYTHADGREQQYNPGKREGIIALSPLPMPSPIWGAYRLQIFWGTTSASNRPMLSLADIPKEHPTLKSICGNKGQGSAQSPSPNRSPFLAARI
jgi:hypothetical protein